MLRQKVCMFEGPEADENGAGSKHSALGTVTNCESEIFKTLILS